MEQKDLDRINFLARKAKAEGLSKDEQEEQAALRKAYLANFRKNLHARLDNVYFVDEQGNKEKLTKKP